MKQTILCFFAALLFAFSSNAQTFEITTKGVGEIEVGMNMDDVPASVKGLYDHIKIVTTPESYNEMDDETIPAYDTYYFMQGMEKVFYTVPNEDGVIPYISVTSKRLSYKGVRPQMSCREVLATKAKLIAGGTYGSCEFFCYFSFGDPNVNIWFEGSFSQQGENKMFNSIANDTGERVLKLNAADFMADAKIKEIVIQTLQ